MQKKEDLEKDLMYESAEISQLLNENVGMTQKPVISLSSLFQSYQNALCSIFASGSG